MNPVQPKKLISCSWFAFVLLAISSAAFGSEPGAAQTADDSNPAPAGAHIKYKSGKDVDFEELLIQGRLKRPEITVVTGDSGNGTDGLLKLRENFVDRMSVDMAEEVK